MTRMWACLAKESARDEVRRAVQRYAPDSNVLFVDSAGELRSWARDAAPGIHVAVGPLEDGASTLNVAAALVRDRGASEVAIVVSHPEEAYARRAQMLGASVVLDSSIGGEDLADGLDEPLLPDEEVPTLIMGCLSPEHRAALQALPTVEGVSQGRTETTRLPSRSRVGSSAEVGSRDVGAQVPPAAPKRLPRQLVGSSAPVIVLVSGRGGVGKTSVVAAMATAAASWGMRVAALDLDLSCGNLYSCFGMDGAADLGALSLENPPTADELYACGRPAADRVFIWGPCARPEMADVVCPQTERLLETLSHRSDLVLVDTSTAITDAVAQAVQQCDRLVLVVDGRHGSAAAQARLGNLAVRLGVARTRIARLANRCGRRGRKEPTIDRGEVGLETARPLRVLDGGVEVADCLGEGKVQDLFELGSKFAESSAESLAKLLNELGRLPDVPQARRLLEQRQQRSIWTFGRVKEAV